MYGINEHEHDRLVITMRSYEILAMKY